MTLTFLVKKNDHVGKIEEKIRNILDKFYTIPHVTKIVFAVKYDKLQNTDRVAIEKFSAFFVLKVLNELLGINKEDVKRGITFQSNKMAVLFEIESLISTRG